MGGISETDTAVSTALEHKHTVSLTMVATPPSFTSETGGSADQSGPTISVLEATVTSGLVEQTFRPFL